MKHERSLRIHCCKSWVKDAVIFVIIAVLVGLLFILVSWVRENPAIIIALAALVFTIFQAMEQRTYARLSVKPILQVSRYFTEMPGRSHFGLFLRNEGAGIALIDRLNITLVGKKAKKNIVSDQRSILTVISDAIHAEHPDFPRIDRYISISRALASNTELPLFAVKASLLTPDSTSVLRDYVSRMVIHIEYSSLYNEPFVHDNKQARSI